MSDDATSIIGFLETVHPYDSLPQDELVRVATSFRRRDLAADQVIYTAGDPMEGLFLVMQGAVEVMDPSGVLVSILGPRNSLGERGLMRLFLQWGAFLKLPDDKMRCVIFGNAL